MKKKLLLSVVLLIAGLSVNAQDWQYIKTDIPNLNMSIDKDTIKKMFTKLCETRAELWNSSSRSAMYTQFSIINTRIRQQIFGEVEND